MLKHLVKKVTLAVILSSAAVGAHATNITGAGASFPYPVYAKWASLYAEKTGNKVNYQSIGSGGGQQQIIAKTVDFGASDDPMSADALEKNGLLQFPAVIGGTVPVVNVEGITGGQLTLSGQVLGDIYLGKIKKWDDAAIVKLNPGVNLPAKDIVVVHRSDGSGTTFGWTNYLSKVNAEWKSKVGEGKAVKWPTGQGGKGNEGVSAYVRQLKNSIGYVEYAYAKQNKLAWTKLINQAGKTVEPEQSAFAAAAANADWKSTPGMGVVLTNEPGDNSWPVTAATFILLHKVADKPAQTKAVLDFYSWSFKNGADLASKLDYVPLPESVVSQIEASWKAELKSADGKAIWN